uniref:Uncharacterized protein n=1 Tax=Peronospora matthiolae TaxID=2874970 RepID=A0AAV1TV79_9STRA
MIKRFLLFVLLLSPGAVSDASLAPTASTLPDGTTPVKAQATKDKARGKQALEPSKDTTAAAVGEERAPVLPSVLEEHVKAASEKMHDWGSWIGSKSALWEMAESALMGKGGSMRKGKEALQEEEAVMKVEKALQKVDDFREREGVTGKQYANAWREVEEASRVREAAWRSRLETDVKDKEASLRKHRAAWETEEAAWPALKTTLSAEIEDLRAKAAATGDEKAESLLWGFLKSSPKDILAKKEQTFDDLTAARKRKLEDLNKKEKDLNLAKGKLALKEIETYKPQFEKMKAHGVTRGEYRNVLGLESSTIAKINSKGVSCDNFFVLGPQYTKYLYFDKFLEYEGSSSDLMKWAVRLFEVNEWKAWKI